MVSCNIEIIKRKMQAKSVVLILVIVDQFFVQIDIFLNIFTYISMENMIMSYSKGTS